MNKQYDSLTDRVILSNSTGRIALTQAEVMDLIKSLPGVPGKIGWAMPALWGSLGDAEALGRVVHGTNSRLLWDYREVWQWLDDRPEIKNTLITGKHNYGYGTPYEMLKTYIRLFYEWRRPVDQRSVIRAINPELTAEQIDGPGKQAIQSAMNRWIKIGLGKNLGGKFVPDAFKPVFVVPAEVDTPAAQQELITGD